MMFKRTILKHINNFIREKSSTAVPANKSAYYKKLNEQIHDEKPEEWSGARPYEEIPGPKPLPIIGNMHRFVFGEFKGKHIAEMYDMLYKEYGDIVLLKGLVGLSDKVFLYSPEGIEKLHRNEGVWPTRDALHSLKYYRSVLRKDAFKHLTGLTTMQGEDWYNFRTIVNPILMQPRVAEQYIEVMDQVASDFVKNVDKLYAKKPEMPENFEHEINRWTMESVYYLALDRRMGCLDDDPPTETQNIIKHTLGAFRMMHKLDVNPSLWKYFNTKDWKEYVTHMDFITNAMLKYIDAKVESIKNMTVKNDSNEKSIFENFLKLDRSVAVSMAVDLMTAGIDTTSKTMSAALYYLSKNKTAQSKLRGELKNLMPHKTTPITKDVLKKAIYLKAVIKETTRLAPIAVGNMRSLPKDIVLCGYQIPKGTDIVTGHLTLCHSEDHFHRCLEFLPERFLRNTQDELSFKNTHPFVFLPFGFGPRSCIGKRLANLELETGLAKIIRKYQLDWHHGDMNFGTTLIYGTEDPLRFYLQEVED